MKKKYNLSFSLCGPGNDKVRLSEFGHLPQIPLSSGNKKCFSSFENNTGHMDGPTDGWTDGPTDGRDLLKRCAVASKKQGEWKNR